MTALSPRAASAALVLLSLLGPSLCAAQTADLRALLREGFDARRAQRDADALRAFSGAWEIDHRPSTRAQIGLAEHALGRWVDAERHLIEALGSDDAWVVENATTLRASLAEVRAHLGSLTLDDAPEGARVALDGRALTTLPLRDPLRVAAGTVVLRVTATGYHPLERTLRVVAGETLRESVALAAETPPPPPRVVSPTRVALPAPLPTPLPAPRVGAPSWGPWALMGAGGASLGVAVTLSLLRSGAVSDLRGRCEATDLSETEAVECAPDAEARSTHDRAILYRDLSFVALGVGVAGVVAGAVWWFVAPATRRATALRLGPQSARVEWAF